MRSLLYQRGSLTFTWRDTLELCGAGWEATAGKEQCMQSWGGGEKVVLRETATKYAGRRARTNTVWGEKDEREAGFRPWRAACPLVGARTARCAATSREGQSGRD